MEILKYWSEVARFIQLSVSESNQRQNMLGILKEARICVHHFIFLQWPMNETDLGFLDLSGILYVFINKIGIFYMTWHNLIAK
jgi:hypothetical protein